MRNHFIKTIFTTLMIVTIPMLSGFCIFQFDFSQPFKINTAQAATFNEQVDNIINDSESCGDNIEKQSEDVSAKNQTLSIKADYGNQNTFLRCCIDKSHNRISSIIRSVDNLPSVSVAVFQEKTLVLPEPKIIFLDNLKLSAPTLSIIKMTVLRL